MGTVLGSSSPSHGSRDLLLLLCAQFSTKPKSPHFETPTRLYDKLTTSSGYATLYAHCSRNPTPHADGNIFPQQWLQRNADARCPPSDINAGGHPWRVPCQALQQSVGVVVAHHAQFGLGSCSLLGSSSASTAPLVLFLFLFHFLALSCTFSPQEKLQY